MAIASIVAKIAGQSYNLTLNSETGMYEATLVAPSLSSWPQRDHKYGIELTATDEAGNVTIINRDDTQFGSELQIRVIETVAPVIVPQFPTDGASVVVNVFTVQWHVSDNDSGINFDAAVIKLDDAVVTAEKRRYSVDGGFDYEVDITTAIAEGPHVLKFDVSDNDGNAATQAVVNFIVDTTAPALNVESPVDGLLTNIAEHTVSGSTDDVTSPPVTVAITVNGVSQGPVTIEEDNTFSHPIVLNAFSNVLKVVATDAVGHSTTVTRSITLDQAPPVFVSVDVAPSVVNSNWVYKVRAVVTDE